MKTLTWKDICFIIIILIIIINKSHQHKYPLTDEWIKKLWGVCVNSMECHFDTEKDTL